jgi:hypothetical protein
MRTTLTLEDDVAAGLEKLRRQSGRSLRDTVNDVLRAGLTQLLEPTEPRPRYRQPSSLLGGCLLPSLDDVSRVLAIAEGDRFA